MRKTIGIFLVLLMMLLCMAAIAQDQAGTMPPPKVLQIGREEVKTGKAPAHARYEAEWTQAVVRAKYPTPYLGLTSITGPSEAWWLTGFDTFAAWEKDAKLSDPGTALGAVNDKFASGDAEYVSGGRTVVATYREDLSYNAAVKLGEMRYFAIATVRVRPGQNPAYVELRKLVNATRSKANVTDAHNAVYEVISGAPSGTFLVFTPVKSLAERDAPPNKAYAEALGDEGRAKISELAGKAILSSETNLYAFSANMSHPSAEMAAADPGFWKPKPIMAKKTAAPAKDAVVPTAKKTPAKQ